MTVLERVRRPSVHKVRGRDHEAIKVIAWMYLFAFDRLPTVEELVTDVLKITDDGASVHDVIVEIMGRDGARTDGNDHSSCSDSGEACKGLWITVSRDLLGQERYERTELYKWEVLIVGFIGNHHEHILTTTAEIKWPKRADTWLAKHKSDITKEVRRQRRIRSSS